MIQWFAVYSQTGREMLAAQHLRNQGFDAYLPVYLKSRRHARREEMVKAPLFPRYLFAGIDTDIGRWRSINGTIGVVGLVMTGDRPMPVSDTVIAAIRGREDATGIVQLTPKGFRQGETVRITGGPMSDLGALFHEMADAHRAILLVELLGRPVRVTVPLPMVTAA